MLLYNLNIVDIFILLVFYYLLSLLLSLSSLFVIIYYYLFSRLLSLSSWIVLSVFIFVVDYYLCLLGLLVSLAE